MTLKRVALCTLFLALGFGLAATAQAAKYSLVGGGAQLHIGGGLPLPIQIVQTTGGGGITATMTNFPPLLIPKRVGFVTVSGTTAMATRQQLTIPPAALSHPAHQTTLGQFGQNPTLYAVATNLGFQWPIGTAVLNTVNRTGANVTTFATPNGNNIQYTAPAAGKFGGPARFAVSSNIGQGLMPQVAVTIYAIALRPTGNPPCTHPAFGGANPACVAALGQAVPNPVAANGGPVGTFNSTPGGTPAAVLAGGPIPGVGIGKFGPNGTVSIFVFTPNGTMMGFTNMASSFGYPLTVGKIKMSAPFAAGAPEVFSITGMDNRTPMGAGTIQLVSGALSQRTLSGPNANRGWVRLVLAPTTGVPAMSPTALAAGAGLLLLAFGYAVRRYAVRRTS